MNFKEVNVNDFKENSEKIIQTLLEKGVKKILVCGIIKPDKVLLKSKNIEREVMQYNEVLQVLSTVFKEMFYIDMFDVSDEEFTIWDGYHYSEKASIYIANRIEDIINHD
jgi:hypothetical protein